MCQVTSIVSGAVSFGVLAGLLSGIFYVVLVGLKWVGKLRLSLEEESVKGRKEEPLLAGTKCRSQNGTQNGLDQYCESCCCNGKPGCGNRSRKNSRKSSNEWCDELDGLTVSEAEDSTDAKTVRIREQIEKLVEKIVGGSLDGVSVGKLSKHAAYLAMFAKHHDSLCQSLARLGYALHFSHNTGNGIDLESPGSAHTALKTLIEKVISEAKKLPNIQEVTHVQNSSEENGIDVDFASKSYEDILATAILNKVIEQWQNRRHNVETKKHRKARTKSMKMKSDNNNNNGNEDEDEGEENDLVYSSDWSDTSRSERLSLTIEEHIEEITTTYENSDDDVNEAVNYNGAIPFPESGRTIWTGDRDNSDGEEGHSSVTDLITSGNSWEDNWLFQRKRLRSGPNAHHPVPVPMLVPNPSQDFRALIGGVDADDLSDMSECSDSVLEDVVLADTENDPTQTEEITEEVESEIVNEVNEIVNESKPADVEDNTGDVTGSPTSLNSESSCVSLSQKERDVSVDYEYFQKLDIEVPDSSLPTSRTLESKVEEEISEPIKCRIAEREKEKWNHPVPLADNPYSAENISKREQRKQRDYFRTGYISEDSVEFPSDSLTGITKETSPAIYSRDYYVKASRCPTGDPSIRTTPVTELFETSSEVSDYFKNSRNRNSHDRSKYFSYNSLSERPLHSLPPSLKRSRSTAKTFSSWDIMNLPGDRRLTCGAHSLRLPTRSLSSVKRSDLDDLEYKTLRENIHHVVLKAKNASPNFIINPLFEENVKDQTVREDSQEGPQSLASHGSDSYQQKHSRGLESGYGSDSLDGSSDSSEFWRLTPPETPEMLESSLVTALELRKNQNHREKRFFGTFPKSKRIRNW